MDDWDDGWDNDGGYDDGNDEGGWQEEGYDEDVVYGEYDEYHGEYYTEYDDDDSDIEGFGYKQSNIPLMAPADDDDDDDDGWFVWSTGYGQGRYEWQVAEYQRQLWAWQEAEYRRQQAEYEQRWAVWRQAEDERDERRRKVLADLAEQSAKLRAWCDAYVASHATPPQPAAPIASQPASLAVPMVPPPLSSDNPVFHAPSPVTPVVTIPEPLSPSQIVITEPKDARTEVGPELMRMISSALSLIGPAVLAQLLSTPYNPAPLIVDPPPPSSPSMFEPENKKREEQIRISAWVASLTATLGSAMDPAAIMFLEQTVHAAAQLAASARSPKLEYAISQMLRSKPSSPVSCLVAGYATPFLCYPTTNILPFPAPIHISPTHFHGRLIPFIDFDGRKRPPRSTSTILGNELFQRSDFIRIPRQAFGPRCAGGRKESWRGGKKLWRFTSL
jgi:hypothetical protein